MTQGGMLAGTPLYMAPAQAKGASLDARTDLFSLGSVLYELATGHAPFRAPNTFAVLRQVTDETPRQIQEVISDIPDWLVAIINKLLAKEPEDRFQLCNRGYASLRAFLVFELILENSPSGW